MVCKQIEHVCFSAVTVWSWCAAIIYLSEICGVESLLRYSRSFLASLEQNQCQAHRPNGQDERGGLAEPSQRTSPRRPFPPRFLLHRLTIIVLFNGTASYSCYAVPGPHSLLAGSCSFKGLSTSEHLLTRSPKDSGDAMVIKCFGAV